MTTEKILGVVGAFFLLFSAVVHFTAAPWLTVYLALIAGFVASAAGVALDVLGTHLGWWRYTRRSTTHAPWLVYVGVIFLEGAVALAAVYLAGRFGPAVLALLIPAVALSMTASDFIAARGRDPVQVMSPGIAPKLGDFFVVWTPITTLAVSVMWVFRIDPRVLFLVVMAMAVSSWAALFIAHRKRAVNWWLCGVTIPLVWAALYCWLMVGDWQQPEGQFWLLTYAQRFTTLPGVQGMFEIDGLLLAGWLDILTCNLVIGAWIARRAVRTGLPYPLLALSFFGVYTNAPFGIAFYLAVEAIRGKLGQPDGLPVAEAVPAATVTLTAPTKEWSTVNTMTLHAFAADSGLFTLKGDPAVIAHEVQRQLRDIELPKINAYSKQEWLLAWGPAIMVKPPLDHIAHTMYVAREDGTDNYVIAIAGTNINSLYDAYLDLDIDSVPWPHAPNAGTIAEGSNRGLQNLLSLVPAPGTEQAGRSLLTFLSSVTTRPATISIAGHSLGGALTHALSMFLVDTQGSQNWDPQRNATVIPYSFAAPTVGDPVWVAHFNRAFQNRGARVWNPLDIVPRAWNVDQVEQVPTLYGNVTKPNLVTFGLIKAAAAAARKHDYVHAHGDGTPWVVPVQPHLTKWGDQTWYQHIGAYFDYIGATQPEWAKRT